MKLKHEDTRRIAAAIVIFAGASIASSFLPGMLGIAVMVGTALVLLLVAMYGLNRERQADLSNHLHQVHAALDLHARARFRLRLPPMTGWAASAVLLSEISSEIQLRHPRLVLELGSGVSTVVMAYALEEIGEGRIVSLEHEIEYLKRTAAELERHGLASWVDLRHAPLKRTTLGDGEWIWYDTASLEGLDKIDLVVVDGPPLETQSLARYPALPLVASRLAKDAVVILDDADRRDERRCLTRWLEEFPDLHLELRDSPKGTAILRRSKG